jgi:hypothetical protein
MDKELLRPLSSASVSMSVSQVTQLHAGIAFGARLWNRYSSWYVLHNCIDDWSAWQNDSVCFLLDREAIAIYSQTTTQSEIAIAMTQGKWNNVAMLSSRGRGHAMEGYTCTHCTAGSSSLVFCTLADTCYQMRLQLGYIFWLLTLSLWYMQCLNFRSRIAYCCTVLYRCR